MSVQANILDQTWDFDTAIDRLAGPHADSQKWNRYAGRDILPLWVADMDFYAPPVVLKALQARVAHGVFGYSDPWPELLDTVVSYLRRHYAWQVDPEWIVWLPSLVTGLNLACRAVDGDVVTAMPVYPPFLKAPLLANKSLSTVSLLHSSSHSSESVGIANAASPILGHPKDMKPGDTRSADKVFQVNGWSWDWAALESALTPTTRLFMLCHPHNPVGRVWNEQELRTMAEIAERRQLVVCSDEIHCDLILKPASRHQPFATVSEAASQRSITLMAPSKTYNVPGLGCGYAVIPNPRLRASFRKAMFGIVPHVNTLGLVACEAALRDADEWRLALLDYLRGNEALVRSAIAEMPGLTVSTVEATYLAWINAAGLGLADPQAFFEAAGVGLSAGVDFGLGEDYRQYVRLNFGCPRATLTQALDRMRQAIRNIA